MEPFTRLLYDLGELLALPLHSDENNACVLVIDELLRIQMQLDTTQERLLLGSMLIELPPGKFRENILKEALKVNDFFTPHLGYLSYVKKENKLVLYNYLMMKGLTAEKLGEHLTFFVENANAWIQALERNLPMPAEFLRKEKTAIPPKIIP